MKSGCLVDTQRKKEFGSSDLKCHGHHAFYVGYNATNVFYSVRKAGKGVWRLVPRKKFTIPFPTMPENAPETYM